MDAPPFLFGLFQPAIRLIPYSLFIGKLYADGFAELYIVVCVSEFSGQFVASEHLNHVAVATCYKQILAVWSDGEIAWMGSCGLKSNVGEQSCLGIYSVNGHSFVLESV